MKEKVLFLVQRIVFAYRMENNFLGNKSLPKPSVSKEEILSLLAKTFSFPWSDL